MRRLKSVSTVVPYVLESVKKEDESEEVDLEKEREDRDRREAEAEEAGREGLERRNETPLSNLRTPSPSPLSQSTTAQGIQEQIVPGSRRRARSVRWRRRAESVPPLDGYPSLRGVEGRHDYDDWAQRLRVTGGRGDQDGGWGTEDGGDVYGYDDPLRATHQR
ncbi:hypothetical protein D9611_014717 [Ephemerocybe angulata]|uniref:Uncharacterized protein n=1 Tax=Ephemerocybe angulata TaxID=980116 RepID=A0A8H5F097_9AGAR|nr:hypothetical protein D9611_014717 [Tulosesus angulatus]